MAHSFVALVAILVAGCSRPVRYPAVPRAGTERATVLGGIPNARFWADRQVPDMAEEALRGLDREREHLRPEFKLVTGAFVAPFAFLGPACDAELREVYTGIGPSDVFARHGYLSIPLADAMTGTSPLFRPVARYANEQMLADIAREYGKGRLLLIGTTNLGVLRPVI